MLVRCRERLRDDSGATLVVILIVMLVLTIGGLALAAVVVNTTSFLVNSRSVTQSRAAADAGLAAAVAAARGSGDVCSTTVPSSTTAPVYSVAVSCGGGQVTFTSTGRGADGATTVTQATYSYTQTTAPGSGADMVFFSGTTFTAQVLTNSLNDGLLSIVIPSGGFTCMAPVPANIVVAGNFTTQGNCDVKGSVITGGVVDMTNGPDTVEGDVTSSGTGSSTVQGTIGGDYKAGGAIAFGWNSKTIGGQVVAGGNVSLGNDTIATSLTVPASKTITVQSGVVKGGTVRPTTVTTPTTPTFDSWFDYNYRASDWPGYTIQTLSTSGSGQWTCNGFNAWPASSWSGLASLTGPTVIDARACPSLSANSGTNPSVLIGKNIVFVANSYDLTNLTFNAATGTTPSVWWIVPDTTADHSPTCSGGAGNVTINGTVMGPGLTTMAYTPCVVDVHQNSQWTGAFYGGSFNYGGGLTFYGAPITVPGMASVTVPGSPSATGTALGALVSQRDIP